MKKYFEFVLNCTTGLAGIFGFFNWINNLAIALKVGNMFLFVLQLVLAPFFIILASILPFLSLAILTFPLAAILYGIYWLINKLINN